MFGFKTTRRFPIACDISFENGSRARKAISALLSPVVSATFEVNDPSIRDETKESIGLMMAAPTPPIIDVLRKLRLVNDDISCKFKYVTNLQK
jgi:hypothetical protein